MLGLVKDDSGSMDANTLVAPITQSTATILASSVDGTSSNTPVLKSVNTPGNTVSRRTGWFFDNLASGTTTYHDLVLFDKLMVTPFTQEKLLPYGVEIFLTLERAKPAFYLMASADNSHCSTD